MKPDSFLADAICGLAREIATAERAGRRKR
jgi:hypothetical protein